MSHPNETIIREMFAAYEQGDRHRLMELLAEGRHHPGYWRTLTGSAGKLGDQSRRSATTLVATDCWS